MRFHGPHRVATAEEDAVRVDGHHPAPLVRRAGLDVADGSDPRAVDHRIETSEALQGFIDDRGPTRLVGYVELHGVQGRICLRRGSRARKVEIGHDDRRAVLGEARGGREPDAAGPAGNQGDFAR